MASRFGGCVRPFIVVISGVFIAASGLLPSIVAAVARLPSRLVVVVILISSLRPSSLLRLDVVVIVLFSS